ncbi:MAG: sigma factor [Myxococcota bacterium]
MAVPVSLGASERNRRLANPQLMREVEVAVRRRVRGDEANDVVQATWADVLQAIEVPTDAEEFRRYVFGVARHKVFDHFRRRAREVPSEAMDEPEQAPEPLSARDILRWAEGKLPDAESKDTLEWMLREGEGEKLEHIARDANLPAPRVRKRVSRLRRFLRQHWAAELLLGGALITLGVYVYVSRSRDEHVMPDERAMPEERREKTPLELARELRRGALERCRFGDARMCLEELDRAKALDLAGDAAPDVVAARRAAADRLAPVPEPSMAPSPVPTNTSETSTPKTVPTSSTLESSPKPTPRVRVTPLPVPSTSARARTPSSKVPRVTSEAPFPSDWGTDQK